MFCARGFAQELGDKAIYGSKMRQVDRTYGDFRERREATIWHRLNRVLKILLFLAFWLVAISLFVPPYKKLTRSRAEIDNLQAQVNDQKVLLNRQEREINLLKTDPTYLETIARDRLDLMKEGETIFRFEPAQSKKLKSDIPARR
jgi:cell division protein FtsB